MEDTFGHLNRQAINLTCFLINTNDATTDREGADRFGDCFVVVVFEMACHRENKPSALPILAEASLLQQIPFLSDGTSCNWGSGHRQISQRVATGDLPTTEAMAPDVRFEHERNQGVGSVTYVQQGKRTLAPWISVLIANGNIDVLTAQKVKIIDNREQRREAIRIPVGRDSLRDRVAGHSSFE